jgi:signal peptidase
VIGVMIVKQITKKKKEKATILSDPLDSKNLDTIEELSDIDKIEKDSEYSGHVEKSKEEVKSDEEAKLDSDETPKKDDKTSEKDNKE